MSGASKPKGLHAMKNDLMATLAERRDGAFPRSAWEQGTADMIAPPKSMALARSHTHIFPGPQFPQPTCACQRFCARSFFRHVTYVKRRRRKSLLYVHLLQSDST